MTYSEKTTQILALAQTIEDDDYQEDELRQKIISLIKPRPRFANYLPSAKEQEQAIDRILLSVLEDALKEAENDQDKNYILKIAKTVYWQGELPKPPNDINSNSISLINTSSCIDLHEHTSLSVVFFLENLMCQTWFKHIVPLSLNVGSGNRTPAHKKDSKGRAPVAASVEDFFRQQDIRYIIELPIIRVNKLPKNWKFSSGRAEQKEADGWQSVRSSKFKVSPVIAPSDENNLFSDLNPENSPSSSEDFPLQDQSNEQKVIQTDNQKVSRKAKKNARARQRKKEKKSAQKAHQKSPKEERGKIVNQRFFQDTDSSDERNKSCCQKVKDATRNLIKRNST